MKSEFNVRKNMRNRLCFGFIGPPRISCLLSLTPVIKLTYEFDAFCLIVPDIVTIDDVVIAEM